MTDLKVSLSVENNIAQISISIDGKQLNFGSSGSTIVPLKPGWHDLSWDSVGNHPAKFTIKHEPAEQKSTQRTYLKTETRKDGSRDIRVL